MAEGLRERKKRQTRQHISDVATGLFLERGFEAVTIAEIAEAAEVSVNTVYNYFPAKEDLFLDRRGEEEVRLARVIEGREPGESAARAVLRDIRARLEGGGYLGLNPGFERFVAVIDNSPVLTARVGEMHGRIRQTVGGTLIAEVGAAKDDPLPMLIADQLAWVESAIFQAAVRLVADGGDRDAVVAELTRRLDVIESLLGERTLNYAVKNTP